MSTKADPADRPATLPSRTAPRPAPHRADPTDAPVPAAAPKAAAAAPKTAPKAAAKSPAEAPAKSPAKAPAKRPSRKTAASAKESAPAPVVAAKKAPTPAPAETSTPAVEADPESLFVPRKRRRPEPTMQLGCRVSIEVRDLLDDHLDDAGARRGDLRKTLEKIIAAYWTGERSAETALEAIDTLDAATGPTVQLASRVSVATRKTIDAAVARTGLTLRQAVEAALITQIR